MFLDRIVTQTRADLVQRKIDHPQAEIQRLAQEQTPPRNLVAAFTPRSRVHLIAEVKRASPSKGMLAPHLNPVELARIYEANGASVISVLTEPHFFLGAPEYLTAIKQAVHIPVLRKDFIIDEYQVYEARAWGADAILLICAILDDRQLRHLLTLAHELHMHCLVEVHSREEAQRAVAAGAIVIGVNSRDLVTFKMNQYLIRDIRSIIPADRIVIAESGIHSVADARRLARYDVQGMLVGESLVVSDDVPAQMQMLLRGANASTQIKICGLRNPEHIQAAIQAGADMLGFIFYEPSHRYIPPQHVGETTRVSLQKLDSLPTRGSLPTHATLQTSNTLVTSDTPPISKEQVLPDLVGVFVNKEVNFINDVVEEAGLHYVQLHGTESPEFCQRITRPVIKAIPLKSAADLAQVERFKDIAWRLLLDTPTPEWGGTGVTHDWELARTIAKETRILLAGGLTPENVAQALHQVHPWGVDVSSGVETHKQKDMHKIRAFIENVRATL